MSGIQKAWLTGAGNIRIEKTPCPDYAGAVDLASPAKGVLHTTEGGWDGSLAVFKQHYAPHFLVGPGRIAQLLPLGHASSALEHPANVPATNGLVRAQIEIVGYSSHDPWLPDTKTLDALTALMAELEAVAGIPLRHVAPARSYPKFAAASGWMGHVDIPGNTHWDPGALKWQAVIDAAVAKRSPAAVAPTPAPPIPPVRRSSWGVLSAKEELWREWAIGEQRFKQYGPFEGPRPDVPNPAPDDWKTRAIKYLVARKAA